MLGPGAVTTHLADLGADVIKVEPPTGDYIRQMTWPIVEGVSLMHLHISRGKRSVVLDLRTPEGADVFRDLVRHADAVLEAMRPGGLARRGLGYEDLRKINPKIVFCTVTGYGMTGPYKDLPSHGIAYDAWAGIAQAEVGDDGLCEMTDHVSMGINAGPLFAAFGILAAVIRARDTGEGSWLEVAQSDAAAAMDWYRSETVKSYERPDDEVTGNQSDNYERRAPAIAGMRGGVRYQFYETSDGHILFMSSEREFWKNFCEGVGRPDLFEAHPGSQYADHARGNTALKKELAEIFRTRTTAEWVVFGGEKNTPIAPANTPKSMADDPQFKERMDWLPRDVLGAEQIPSPVKFIDEDLPVPTMAPTVGQHTEAVLRDVLGYDADRVDALRAAGALGKTGDE
jgi:crotonobetainyl-CoA:carnitine CoA-transferase CaiB-like acyl-CoA transferase